MMTNGLIISPFNPGTVNQGQYKGQQDRQPVTPLRQHIIQVQRLSSSTTGLTIAITTNDAFPDYVTILPGDEAVRNPLIASVTMRAGKHRSDHIKRLNEPRTAGGKAGPNALRQIARQADNQVESYTYDDAGNLINSSLGLKITYDGNHHTKTVERNGALLTFWYDAGGQRFKQTKAINNVTTTTYYVGNVEFVSDDSGDSSRDYIGDHSIVTRTLSGQVDSPLLSHTLRDRFGSVSVVVNADVSLTTAMERRDYDAFGKPISLPRNPDLLIHFVVTSRGFTDHEHLTEVELIHMNGRAYDYNTGRFLSVDPFIQSPANSQSVNPYSYIMNNPLSGIDPTGYVADKLPAKEGGDSPDNNDGSNPADEYDHRSACKAKGGCSKGLASVGTGNGAGKQGTQVEKKENVAKPQGDHDQRPNVADDYKNANGTTTEREEPNSDEYLNGILEDILNEDSFRQEVINGLHDSVGVVIENKKLNNENTEVGVALIRNEDGEVSRKDFPNGVPSTNTVFGEEGVVGQGNVTSIDDAVAITISLDNTITDRHFKGRRLRNRFAKMSNERNAPIFVTSPKASKVYMFAGGYDKPIEVNF